MPVQLRNQLRRATHSAKITPQMMAQIPRPNAQRMPVPRGMMLPGLGAFAQTDLDRIANRVIKPMAKPIPRTRSTSMALPLAQRVPMPRTTALASPAGNWLPGIGGDDDLAGPWMPGMGDLGAAVAHRKTKVLKVQKPRTMGTKAQTRAPAPSRGLRVDNSFIPGIGEEDDSDTLAMGYLTSRELADDEMPSNTANPGMQAAAAGASTMKTLVMVTGAALLLGAFLRMR